MPRDKYFLLKPSNIHYTEAHFLNAEEFVYAKLTLGKSLSDKLPVMHIDVSSDFYPPDYFLAGPLQIGSKKLTELLEINNVSVQLFPIKITQKGKAIRGAEFYFCNFLEVVDCLDYERSDYTLDDEMIDRISTLVINEEKINGKDLIRMGNCYNFILIVSENLKLLFLKGQITGLTFLSLNEWKG